MMNFIIGKVPDNLDFNPQSEGWEPLKEPNVWIAQLIGIPIGLLAALIVGLLWHVLTPMSNFRIELGVSTLIWIAGIVVVHELIHAVFHPGYGITSNTYLGFWPSKLLFYAHYHSKLSKEQFMAILIAPFVFISLVPLLFCILFQYSSMIAYAISLFNILLACVDIFGFFLIYYGVPSGSIVQNKGWKTYYKKTDD